MFGKSRDPGLGHRERAVMEILWERGESSVNDVTPLLDKPLAYTTVMTTLDRLYKKGLLERRRDERAFVYWPRYSRDEWGRRRAGEFVADFLSEPEADHVLISCFVEMVGGHDAALLDELEEKIRAKRRELNGGGQ